MNRQVLPAAICLMGPTAAGKTDLAVALATAAASCRRSKGLGISGAPQAAVSSLTVSSSA